MTLFRIRWEIDIESDSAQEAAEKALQVQRDAESTATVFEVTGRHDATERAWCGADPDWITIDLGVANAQNF
jgi:hydrogenase maturation factor